jgi:tetratricopeptide (TPR) repeat protein
LQAAKIPACKILRSLKRLKATLPSELPLSGLRITAVGSEVAVKEGNTHWGADSGQLLMDFEIRPAAQGTVRFLAGKVPMSAEPAMDPTELFNRGVELEGKDKASAEAAYRQAIGAAPDYVDPVLNLGVMLCDAGRCEEAAALYAQALRHRPDEALLYFNLAIALEDMKRENEALAAYERCLQIDPKFADAHFNAAQLHEQMGHANRAIRHYSEYRRLQR